eukprot:1160129-Pelagomonas_calceolata.AAC.2
MGAMIHCERACATCWLTLGSGKQSAGTYHALAYPGGPCNRAPLALRDFNLGQPVVKLAGDHDEPTG